MAVDLPCCPMYNIRVLLSPINRTCDILRSTRDYKGIYEPKLIYQKGVMARTDRIASRCTPDERETFQDVADDLGITLSNWVLMTLRREAERYLIERGMPVPFLDRKAKRKVRNAEPEIPSPKPRGSRPLDRDKPSDGE